jgi:[histone H3]-lysine36 N-dimethyltransferase SETMAR
MECQVEKNIHFRHLLLFAFNQGITASKATRDICAVYGEGDLVERTARYWYAKFKNGNFDLKDSPRSGRPVELDEETLNELLHEDPRQTTREIAEKMKCSHITIERHLHSMGKVRKYGAWLPHVLNESNKNLRCTISAGLLARHRSTQGHKQQFLYRIVTGDEKWCLYVNMKQRKEWLSPDKQATPRVKQDPHPRKMMLCVWWDWIGIIHYELLERNQTVNAELYVQQMERLNTAIQEKRNNQKHGVLLLHDNARPHIAKMTKEAIQKYGWEVLAHPPYSPDLAPTDFHLFRSLSNAMHGVTFSTDAELRVWLDYFFDKRPCDFYRHGIENLVERWEEVVNNHGEYIID